MATTKRINTQISDKQKDLVTLQIEQLLEQLKQKLVQYKKMHNHEFDVKIALNIHEETPVTVENKKEEYDYINPQHYVQSDGIFDQQFDSDPLSELLESAAAKGGYTLYLDFDGATVYSRAGDFWLGSQSVDIPAYNLEQFGWSGRETESIDYITNFVRDDYTAYNVNVTSD